eukprot:1161365-Pelagomonas_calceolata.AAC.3
MQQLAREMVRANASLLSTAVRDHASLLSTAAHSRKKGKGSCKLAQHFIHMHTSGACTAANSSLGVSSTHTDLGTAWQQTAGNRFIYHIDLRCSSPPCAWSFRLQTAGKRPGPRLAHSAFCPLQACCCDCTVANSREQVHLPRFQSMLITSSMHMELGHRQQEKE